MNRALIISLIILFGTVFSAEAATYKGATRLLGKERVQSDINLSGQTKTDGEIVRYLQTRNCNRNLRPYYITKMNVDFRRRLYTLMKSADRVGYYMYIYSGARKPSDQRRIQRTSKNGKNRKWVGSVYGSKHVKGIAADIKVGGCRGRYPRHGDWLHRNAGRHKLYFRMSWEPWHIEPVEGEKIKDRPGRRPSSGAAANIRVSQPYQTQQAVQYRQAQSMPVQQTVYADEQYSSIPYDYSTREESLAISQDEVIVPLKASALQRYLAVLFARYKKADESTSFIIYRPGKGSESDTINARDIEYTIFDAEPKDQKWYRI